MTNKFMQTYKEKRRKVKKPKINFSGELDSAVKKALEESVQKIAKETGNRAKEEANLIWDSFEESYPDAAGMVKAAVIPVLLKYKGGDDGKHRLKG